MDMTPGTEERFRRDRLADLCAAYREACDTSDYPDASPPRYQAAARFRLQVNPDDVCALIDEVGERR